MEPENAIIRSNRAAVLTEQHKYHEAIEDLNVAITADPQYVKAYYRIAIAYREITKFENALSMAEQGLVIAPDNEDL
jgi:tetratricopeptide (TPR) repeat protein